MSKTIVQSYLFFGGNCEEAVEFYKTAVDAKVEMVMHFNESPEPVPEGMIAPGFENKVMHASFSVGDTTIMASDGREESADGFKGFMLAISAPTAEEATSKFNALSEGGNVIMPLAKVFWSPLYGMLTDKFGVGWMVMVMPEDCE